MPDLNDYMTTEEAAKELGFHVKTIPAMIRNGALSGIRFGNKVWLVSRESVKEYKERTAGMAKRDPRRTC